MKARRAKAAWVPPGQAVRVRDHQISDGMVYVGKGPEPSLIDPALPLEPAGRLGLQIDGWVAYSQLRPEIRTGYLEWLAGGRSAPEAPQLFLFLFFCGLERRVLSDIRASNVSNAEILSLIAEVERLLETYGRHSRFAYCAAYFVTVARLLIGDLRPEALEPLLERVGARSRVVWDIGPALLAATGRPPTPRWAFALWSRWDLARRATPAFRCPAEVRDLFLIYSSEILPAVFQFRQGRAPLVVHYQPANPSLPAPFVLKMTGVREVRHSRDQMEQLQRVADRVFADLAPYSRWLGRNGKPSSPAAALALLPPDLARSWESEESRRLVRWIEKELADGDCAVLSRQDVQKRWPVGGKLTRRDFEDFAVFLGRSGYGIEPEPRRGGPLPQRGCFLFRLPDPEAGWSWLPSPAYARAALILQLAVAVAAADGPADPRQEERLLGHVKEAARLEPMERMRLQIRLAWLLAEPQSLAGSRERCSELSESRRLAVTRFLITVAGADGHVSPGEIRQLKKIYRLLGRDPEALYADIHALAAGVPLVAKTAQGSGLELDLSRVEDKLAETERVSTILGDIFSEEERAPPAQFPAGLDAPHAALLRELAVRATWDRAEIDRLATVLGLLPDGALEALNEAAFARCGALLLEGGETLELDAAVLEVMLT